MDRIGAVVLAAGQGTRMKSHLPKVLHPLAGQPMLYFVLEALAGLRPAKVAIVVGHQAEEVRGWAEGAHPFGTEGAIEWVAQPQQLGTAHAVLQARPALEGCVDTVLVVYGDTPLLRGETLRDLVNLHQASQATITLLTATVADPQGYGRVVRGADGRVVGILEEAAATPQELALKEINSGVACFRADWLWPRLRQLAPSPQGEYYLTDLAARAAAEGEAIRTLAVPDAHEALGINDRLQLAQAEAVVQSRLRENLMRAGVTLVDPPSCLFHAGVTVGPDTVILPHTLIYGRTHIGAGCTIGPSTFIIDTVVGEGCRIVASVVEGARLEEGVRVGPFAHLRPGTHLARGVDLGNFAEVKNAYLGEETRMHHFGYVGDATIGRGVNIGAGTVTCNYDSETGVKSRTVVEDGAALGSDTMLVAPVRVGPRAITGAGAVVTRDIPADSVALGVPAAVRRRRKGSGGAP